MLFQNCAVLAAAAADMLLAQQCSLCLGAPGACQGQGEPLNPKSAAEQA